MGNDRRDASLIVRDREWDAGAYRDVQARLRDVDANEHGCPHDTLLSRPALRNAGSVALATVRALQVKEHDDPR